MLAEGRYRLTPLYDVISAWPIAGARHDQLHPKKLKLAMALRGNNKHYRLVDIRRAHFDETARLYGLGSDMGHIIDEVVASTPAVIENVGARLPRGFPEALFASVTAGLTKAAKEIAR